MSRGSRVFSSRMVACNRLLIGRMLVQVQPEESRGQGKERGGSRGRGV